MPHFVKAIWLLSLFPLAYLPGSFQEVDDTCLASHPTRVIRFADRNWQVKTGIGLGPGNNNWSDKPEGVWVDSAGSLHLRIRQEGATWYSAQVSSVDFAPPGLYRFFVQTPLHNLDENTVLGLFLYQDDRHEIDIEFLRRDPSRDANAVYVVQPYAVPGNRHPFDWHWPGPSTHDIDWRSDAITFRSLQGHDPQIETIMHLWRYEGGSIPDAQAKLRIQMNLWLLDPLTQSREVEVIIADLQAPVFTRPAPTLGANVSLVASSTEECVSDKDRPQ